MPLLPHEERPTKKLLGVPSQVYLLENLVRTQRPSLPRESCQRGQVSEKAKAMIVDFLSSINLPENKNKLTPKEEEWLSSLIPSALKVSIAPQPSTFEWEIRLDPSTFTNWHKSLQRHSLFFDEASKGNPSEAGKGGVIIDPEEIKVLSYSRGIDKDTNNIAEPLAL